MQRYIDIELERKRYRDTEIERKRYRDKDIRRQRNGYSDRDAEVEIQISRGTKTKEIQSY